MAHDELMKMLYKEVVSLDELRKIMANPLVDSVSMGKPDGKHHNFARYDVKLENGELHFVYLKPKK
jgi:hypothetical protein